MYVCFTVVAHAPKLTKTSVCVNFANLGVLPPPPVSTAPLDLHCVSIFALWSPLISVSTPSKRRDLVGHDELLAGDNVMMEVKPPLLLPTLPGAPFTVTTTVSPSVGLVVLTVIPVTRFGEAARDRSTAVILASQAATLVAAAPVVNRTAWFDGTVESFFAVTRK